MFEISRRDLVLNAADTAASRHVPGALIADSFHACGLDVPRAAVTSICLPTTTALLATGKFLATLSQSFIASAARGWH